VQLQAHGGWELFDREIKQARRLPRLGNGTAPLGFVGFDINQRQKERPQSFGALEAFQSVDHNGETSPCNLIAGNDNRVTAPSTLTPFAGPQGVTL
jgi:hypothetical protein